MERSTPQAEWRCTKCGGLLGVERYGCIYLKHRRAQFVVRGEVMAVCHRCSELNEARSSDELAPACPNSGAKVAISPQQNSDAGHGARQS